MMGNFTVCLRLIYVLKSTFLEKSFSKPIRVSKQFEFDQDVLLRLIGVQTVCKGRQQAIKIVREHSAGQELNM